MFSDLGGSIVYIGLIVIGIVVAWFTGNMKGKATAKVAAAEQRTKDKEEVAAEIVVKNQEAIKEQNKTTVQANEIDEDVARMSDADVLSELHNAGRTATKNDNDGDKK